MKRASLVLAVVCLSAGTGDLEPVLSTDGPHYSFETALQERFDDPASVVLRHVRHSADGRAYCGEVNGLDRHGVLTGYRAFVVYGGQGAFMVMIAEDDGRRLRAACD